MKSLSKRNIILYCVIAVMLVTSLISWFMISNATTDSTIVAIYKNRSLIRTVDISDHDLRETFSIGTPEDGINVIRIKNGEIWVDKDSDCPDKICANSGHISINNRNLPIICLPNRLEIRVISADKDNDDLDAVVR